MCRYGSAPYKVHYACFSCRKVFRHPRSESEAVQVCPDCRGPMADMGMDLRAPKRSDIKQWKILEGMYRAGHAFQTCGCHGPGLIPANTNEYRDYLREREAVYREQLAALQRDTALPADERNERAAYWTERLERIERAQQAMDR